VLLLLLITLNDTYMLGRTPLDEGSAHLPYNTQRSQQTDIMPSGDIRTRIHSTQDAPAQRLKADSHIACCAHAVLIRA